MERLLKIGFKKVGCWLLKNGKIVLNLNAGCLSKQNVLYAYISDGEVKYIGKTNQELSKRLYGYENPGPSQSTNIRINKNITELLLKGETVDIFAFINENIITFGGFEINIAAGLEDSLIKVINPPWNKMGNKNYIVFVDNPTEIISENFDLSEIVDETISTNSVAIQAITTIVQVTLSQTYYNNGFFNLPIAVYNLIALEHGIEIEIILGTTGVTTGHVNRTANQNGTPRIMAGNEYTQWVQQNFKLNNILNVEILTPTKIRLFS